MMIWEKFKKTEKRSDNLISEILMIHVVVYNQNIDSLLTYFLEKCYFITN